MKALVTGGGGFLGSAMVRMLQERGDEVSVLARGTYPHLAPYVQRRIQGDIRLTADVRRACEGMDAVFHVAAKAGVWGRRSEYRSINVDGTRNVIQACRELGIGRLIYTSTPSVVFGRGDLCGVDESHPYPRRYLCGYAETKAEAEKIVLSANDATLATIALRPHLIWGPGDPHLIPRVLERARTRRLVQVGDGTNLVDITYIDNAAAGHLAACDALRPGSPCAGRAYFINQGRPVELWPWLGSILEAVGRPNVTRRCSFKKAYAIGAILELVYGAAGSVREPPMTRFVATQLAKSHYFNIESARRDFGYAVRVPTEDGFDRLIRWLRSPTDQAVRTHPTR